MKKILKKRYFILFIIVLLISAICLFLFVHRNKKIEIAKNDTNIIESYSKKTVDEITEVNNQLVQDVINSNTTNEQTIELESITEEKVLDKAQDEALKITSNNYAKEKEIQTKEIATNNVK